MASATPILGIPYPEGADNANVPLYLQEIAEALEAVLLGSDTRAAVVPIGTTIFNVHDVHFGRWLRLDGVDRTQAEVEAALGLTVGQAAAFAALMGTGAGSKFGAAAAGKIRIPDVRRRIPIAAGPAGDGSGALSARALGVAAGEEAHALTKTEGSVPSHGHAATQPAHSHAVTDPGHAHGPGTLVTDDPGTHRHAIDQDNHFQGAGGVIAAKPAAPSGFGGGNVGADGAHTHQIVGGNTAGSVTSISLQNTTPTVSITDHPGADAANPHNNMPPNLVVGFGFIRV